MERRFLLAAMGIVAGISLLASCHSHDAASVPSQEAVNVSLNLPSATVNVSGQMLFTATVTGSSDNSVKWYVNDKLDGDGTVGTIVNGLYTAPANIPSPATVTVKATSVADTTKSATLTVTIQSSERFLPGTGQTTSYATGDDGDSQKGTAWPNPRFTVGTGSEAECVRDNLTGLMWVKSPDTTKRTWPDALTHANGLSRCGYDDWRLPNRKELFSLVDFSKVRPSLTAGNPFTNVQADFYWTSTAFSYNSNPSGDAWHFSMAIGDSGGGSDKNTALYYVWPVRSAQIGAVALPKTGQTTMYAAGDDGDLQKGTAWPNPRFIAGTGSEVDCITDNLTGLMWMKNPDLVPRTWQRALDNASNLSVCGYDDWRLPNINELESVTNPGVKDTASWLATQGVSGLASSNCIYWSSTTYADNTELAWRVGLCSSNFSIIAKTAGGYSWPVRSVPVPKFAYVANGLDNNVSAYTINATTGALTSVSAPVATGWFPHSVTADPSGKFVYVANIYSNDVSAYAVDATTGVLTSIGTYAAGTKPYYSAVHRSGKFLYVVNNESFDVSAYSINAATGALTSVGAPVATGWWPYSITVDPSGKFAYVANSADNNVSAYTIIAATGALTSAGTYGAGNGPISVAVDPSGKFAYVANNADNNVSAYTINAATGALTSVGTYATGVGPWSVAVAPSGKFVYVANYDTSDVSAYTVNATTGELTGVGTYAAVSGPTNLTVDPSGKFVYVTNSGSNNVSAYTINPTTGELTSVGAPFAAGRIPRAVSVVAGNR